MKPKLKLIITPSKQIESLESKLREYRNEKTKLEDRITEFKSKFGIKSTLNSELLEVMREHHISVRPGLLRQIK